MSNKLSALKMNPKEPPLVSVILPVYNGATYLGEAVNSILAQTFTNFELIIIDDGSTDNTLALLKKYQSLDSRIRLISRDNRNLVATLNELIDLARGEWVARMDADDISLPNRFERQLQQLEKSGADICGSWIKYFGSGNRHTLKYFESDLAIKVDMLFNSPFAHPSVMMRTSLVRGLRYDKKYEKAEDYDLWVRAVQANWKMTNVTEVLLKYRIHNAQTTNIAAIDMLSARTKIQKRYWDYVVRSLDLRVDNAKEAFNMASDCGSYRIDKANITYLALLKLYKGESKRALIKNISRIYLNASYSHPEINEMWRNLSLKDSELPGFTMYIKLSILRYIKIKNGSKSFIFLKKIYNFLLR